MFTMNQECQDVIIENFVKLMKCDVEALSKPLIKKGVFRNFEINQIFSTDDEKHNKRIFFFSLLKKEKGWIPFLEALRETNQDYIANMLQRKGATVFNEIMDPPDIEEESLPDLSKITINGTTDTLKVKVILSSSFYDTPKHNGAVGYYICRSKKRGRCLIINNYEFQNREHPEEHPYRNGALVDLENLKSLFNQMGGWDLDCHVNKTALQMDMIIKNFANYKNNHMYDICFIIIMSHGGEIFNETIIYGIDNKNISVSGIRKLFSNENCVTWRGKPKILLVPVCRGAERHIPIKHEQRTEADGKLTNSQATNVQLPLYLRSDEDMLIGYSTLLGYQSHRDYNRGTWYIEVLCHKIMNHAHDHSLNDIMLMVDGDFKLRISEKWTMQTSEIVNIGFKKLYLNPGLYQENGTLKKYIEEADVEADVLNGSK